MAEPTPEPAAAEQAGVEHAVAEQAAAEPAAVEPSASKAASAVEGVEGDLVDFPKYARRLLRIQVPLTVTLASQRASIGEIVELGPGSIVKFEKTCDQPLELSIGDRLIATGEAVKVGDKFGLRIGELVTPPRAVETA